MERRLPSAATLSRFVELADKDKSQVVRLYLAAALQRLPAASRLPILQRLVAHAEDAGDHNLGLMIWFGIEPLVGMEPPAGVELAMTSQHRVVRQFIARRLAEDTETKPDGLNRLLAAVHHRDGGRLALPQFECGARKLQ